MTASATASSSFMPINDRLFADNYFGSTEPVQHKLPMFSDGDGPSFKDLVDVINPLQHIPVVSTIYRELTGDQPGAASRIVGGALYGGPIGLLGEVINCAIDDNTGKDVGGHTLAFLKDEFSDPSGQPSDGGGLLAMAPPDAAKPASMGLTEGPPIQTGEPPVAEAAPIPVVTSQPVSGPMSFGADGVLQAPPAAPQPVAENAPPNPAVTADQAKGARFMPVPTRRIAEASQPPPVHLPVSTNGQRSNVPVTGRSPNPFSVPNPVAGQRLTVDQMRAAAAPMTMAPQMAAMPGATPTTSSPDWFSASMVSALEKYKQANKLNPAATVQPSVSVVE